MAHLLSAVIPARRFSALFLAAALLLCLSGCGSAAAAPGAPPASSASLTSLLSQTAPVSPAAPASSASQASQAAHAAEDPEAGEKTVRYLESMDTVFIMTAYGGNREKALDAAGDEVKRLNGLFSIGEEESDISRLNRSGTLAPAPDTLEVISRALSLSEETGGLFDITVLPLMELWGFTTKEYRVPDSADIGRALKLVDASRVRCDEKAGTVTLGDGQSVDLGGIAKGYTSQRIMECFLENGVTSGMVSLGGNVQCLGGKPDGSPWKIGIRNPFSADGYAAVLSVRDCAVITAGGYERYFTDGETGRTYVHIMDPKTGAPAESDLASATVVTGDGTLGDALSTALYIMGGEKAAGYWRDHAGSFEAVLVTKDGRVLVTEGLKDSVTGGTCTLITR